MLGYRFPLFTLILANMRMSGASGISLVKQNVIRMTDSNTGGTLFDIGCLNSVYRIAKDLNIHGYSIDEFRGRIFIGSHDVED